MKIVNSSKPSATVVGIGLVKPMSGTITSRYGARWGSTHTGLDIAAPTGTTIAACASGTVTYSGNSGSGYGNYVIIDHGKKDGVSYTTVYAHMKSVSVKKGDTVVCTLPSIPEAVYEILPLSPAFITQGGPGCVAIQAIQA